LGGQFTFVNTIGSLELLFPKEELELLKKLVRSLRGKIMRFKENITWKTMSSLGLECIERYGLPKFNTNTFILNTYMPFDIFYVRNFGERKGYLGFNKNLLQKLEKDGLATAPYAFGMVCEIRRGKWSNEDFVNPV